MAVRVRVPTVRVVTLKVAHCPALRATGLAALAPSMANCTVPVGLTLPLAGATKAVKVTFASVMDGFWLEVNVVVVLTGLTVCVSGEAAPGA